MLARKVHVAGNITRYILDYCYWLPEGVHITTATVSLVDPAPDDVTLGTATIGQSGLVYFTVGGGSVSETFTVQVEVVNSIGEHKIDTISFTVTAP